MQKKRRKNRKELTFDRTDPATGEPTGIGMDDGWPFVRLSNGIYTDGDMVHGNLEELIKNIGGTGQ